MALTMASSQLPANITQIITINSGTTRWVMQDGVGNTIITKEGVPFTITPMAPLLPDMPLPQSIVQSVISSSCDSSSHHVTSSNGTSSSRKVGSDPCSASVACMSMKELRLKGSSFLRTHASKHGIPNASRKLTAQVTAELSQHYQLVHKVHIIHDDYKESAVASGHSPQHVGSVGKAKKRSHSNSSRGTSPTLSLIPQLPQHPVPMTPLLQHLQQQQQQNQQPVQQQVPLALTRVDVEQLIKKELSQPLPQQQQQHNQQTELCDQAPRCRAEILVKTRAELSACGTSMLRPEAAAHKVHNASRKPKEVVVEELWQHYLQCHQKDFEAAGVVISTEPGWVGNVTDEDEEGLRK